MGSASGATPTSPVMAMPTIEPQPSDEVVDKAEGALRGRRRLWRRRLDDLLPHRVYSADLRTLAGSPSAEESTRFVGWQFLVPRPRDPLAIEVSEEGLGVQIETGTPIEGVRRVFLSAHKGDEDERSEDEQPAAWVLRVPEMGLMAVWFRS